MAVDWAWIREIGGPAWTQNAWFLVLSGKKRVGQQGRLMWAGITGSSRALSSSPDAERVSRAGLAFDGPGAVEFIDAKHLMPLPRKLSQDDLTRIEMARDFAIRKEFGLAREQLRDLSDAAQSAARIILFQLEAANKGKRRTASELDRDIEEFLREEASR